MDEKTVFYFILGGFSLIQIINGMLDRRDRNKSSESEPTRQLWEFVRGQEKVCNESKHEAEKKEIERDAEYIQLVNDMKVLRRDIQELKDECGKMMSVALRTVATERIQRTGARK